MTELELIPKFEVIKELDLRNLSTLNILNFNSKKIKKIQIRYGYKKINLEDLFNVVVREVKSSNTFRKVTLFNTNHFFDNVGYQWSNDLLHVKGNIGSFLGTKMINGKIKVDGSTEDYLGCEMVGGEIYVNGNALNFVGSSSFGRKVGMTGGLISVNGSTGHNLGSYMRRGMILVGKKTGNYCANNLIAGTIIVRNTVGNNFCLGMKRGTIILLNNYKKNYKNMHNCGEQEINFVSIIRNFVKRKGFVGFTNCNIFERFIGDQNNAGLGEVLIPIK